MDAAWIGSRLRVARERHGVSQQAAAEALGLPRTAVTNIESGNRAVSTLELTRLARLYAQPIGRILDEAGEVDVSVVLLRAVQQAAGGPDVDAEINRMIDLCREGTALRQLLGQEFEANLPNYAARIGSTGEAVRQGEQVAREERNRLGLGIASLGDIAELISSQGLWVAATTLPEGVSGLFVNHIAVGLAILIHGGHPLWRRRFSYAHEYAHALFDRGEPVRLTRHQNSGELVEKRANAFAAAFLMPADGVAEQLRRLDKGQPSRQTQIVFDVARGDTSETEIRPPVRSQVITYQDIATIARHFGVSFETAVWRLRNLGHLGAAETTALIDQQDLGRRFMQVLRLGELFGDDRHPAERDQELRAQIARLAVEAYRREEISQGRLREIAGKLAIDADGLVDLARAAHGA